MIPVLNNGIESGLFKNTLADQLLSEYQLDLKIDLSYGGKVHSIPVWKFIERYLRIKDKRGRKIAFELNIDQIEVYKDLCDRKRRGERMWLDILKARQLGMSTFIAAVYFSLTIFSPNKTAVIIADTAEHATNLFKKYKFMYENLPPAIRKLVPKKQSNAKELVITYGNGDESSIKIVVQGENAGRSDTCQYLHLSEVAFWNDIEETLTSVLQTIDIENKDSIVTLETTANGVNDYKVIWDQDASGDGEYQPKFFAWYSNPNYSTEYSGFELLDFEKEMVEKYSLSLNQIAWYHSMYMMMHRNLEKLRQEHPSCPSEAFITSGNSKFNMELIQKRKEEVLKTGWLKKGEFNCNISYSPDGSQIEITEIEFVEFDGGSIKIYEEPDPTHFYVVNNDPAMGGEDYYAIQVIDNCTMKQVAVYWRNKCDADVVAKQLYCLGVYYNEALISGETNTTSYLLHVIEKTGYKNIYQEQDYEDLSNRFQNRLGYKTTTKNRQAQIDMFAIAFREDYQMINDYQTLCEMETFQVVRNDKTAKEKVQATNGNHDDLVMAMCGIFLCRHNQLAIPINRNENKSIETLRMFKKPKNKLLEDDEVYQRWD